MKDFFEPSRIVVGSTDPRATRTLLALYRKLPGERLVVDPTTAELIKYATNAFLATKISFINEIAMLCDLVGASVDRVAEGVGYDDRIGPAFLRAGIGYGGSCFPKDTRALDFLATLHGYDFHLLRAVIDVNARQRMLPVRALKTHFGSLQGRRVAILGLTFKPETDDAREAPATEIVELLHLEGAAVVGYNPIPVVLPGLHETAETLADAVRGADAVILATEWTEIVGADWPGLIASMAPGALVFDGRNALDPAVIHTAGARYIGVGRPANVASGGTNDDLFEE